MSAGAGSAKGVVLLSRFRISPEWLRAHKAGDEGPLTAAGRMLTVEDAVGVALDAGWIDWAVWLAAELLADIAQPRECVRYACRRAHSVLQNEAGENAIALAERWADGGTVTAADLQREAAAGEAMASARRAAAAAAAAQDAVMAEAAAAWSALVATRAVEAAAQDAADAAEAERAAAAETAAEAAWAMARNAAEATEEAAAEAAAEAAWSGRAGTRAARAAVQRAAWMEAAADLQRLADLHSASLRSSEVSHFLGQTRQESGQCGMRASVPLDRMG